MTLIEALPRNEEGDIVIPVAGITGDGTRLPGTTSENFLRAMFPDHVDLAVPLSEPDYQSLLDLSTPNWKLNWQEFRSAGII